jgi:hypothetical protein
MTALDTRSSSRIQKNRELCPESSRGLTAGDRVPELVRKLNAEGVPPPRSEAVAHQLPVSARTVRQGWHTPKSHNVRACSDEDVKEKMMKLRNHGHTYAQIASILNELKWVPLKGRKFTTASVGKLLRGTEQTKYLTPKQYLEAMLRNMEKQHNKLHPMSRSRGRASHCWRPF